MGFRGYVMLSRPLQVIISKPVTARQHTRCASTYNHFAKWYRSIFAPKGVKPPYEHICQVGDPVLRQAAQRVSPDQISLQEIQKAISILRKVMKQYDVSSLSAPQIGLPLQIFVIEVNKEALEKYTEQMRNILKMSIVPPKVIINPAVKVLDYTQEANVEMCPSVRGLAADVNRYSKLKITAYDEKAELREWEAAGFESRIIQHEMDHLAGLLFTDRMDSKTLECVAWEAVNRHKGQVYIPFWPKKKRRGLLSDAAT